MHWLVFVATVKYFNSIFSSEWRFILVPGLKSAGLRVASDDGLPFLADSSGDFTTSLDKRQRALEY